MSSPIATIVVCTYNRSELLAECLSSLAPQLRDTDEIELLVIDNRSNDDTADVVQELAHKISCLRYFYESAQGRSHARNRGLKEASTDWVAFLDDDARVLTGYVEQLVSLVGEGRFDIVGGVYVPWYSEGKAAWFRDEYASNSRMVSEQGEMPEGRYASGGIMLVSKPVVDRLGGFDIGLGMGGGAMGYGEETHLQLEVRRAGGKIGGAPDWRIEHLAPRAKQRLSWLLLSAWFIGRDSWRTFDRRPAVSSLLGLLRRLVTRPVMGLYEELSDGSKTTNWRTLLLSMARPVVMTTAELMAGIRLMLGRN